MRELWRPTGFATEGDPAFLVDFAKRLARADSEAVYLVVAPIEAGDPWEEPVVVVRPDGTFAFESRRALLAGGVAVPAAAVEGHCVEVGVEGRRCDAPPVVTAKNRSWCAEHLPYSVTGGMADLEVVDFDGFFPAAFSLVDLPEGAAVQVLLVGGFGAMRFRDGLVVDWLACPQHHMVRSHFLADGTCRCPPTAR